MTIIDTFTRARDALQSERELAATSGGFSKVAEYAGLISDLNAAIAAAGWRRFRHKKRGTEYTEVCRGELQASYWPLDEGDEMVVYRGDDGKVWIRSAGEFDDGRFEELPAPPAKEPE